MKNTMAEKITPDEEISNADWPKRTPDTFEDLDNAMVVGLLVWISTPS